MKKVLSLIIFALFISTSAMAQDPMAIFNAYLERTGTVDYEGVADGESSLCQIEVEMMGQVMPIKVVAKYPDQYRVDMEMQGMNILTIITGGVAYMTVGGQTQVFETEEEIAQLVPMTDFVGSMVPSLDDCSEVTYVGTDGKGKKLCDVIQVIDNETGYKSRMYINQTTNLLTKLVTVYQDENGKEGEVATLFTKYTEFADGEIYLPATMTIKTDEGDLVINVLNFEVGYPTAAWMFAAPKL